jgi:hypothetical protein
LRRKEISLYKLARTQAPDLVRATKSFLFKQIFICELAQALDYKRFFATTEAVLKQQQLRERQQKKLQTKQQKFKPAKAPYMVLDKSIMKQCLSAVKDQQA